RMRGSSSRRIAATTSTRTPGTPSSPSATYAASRRSGGDVPGAAHRRASAGASSARPRLPATYAARRRTTGSSSSSIGATSRAIGVAGRDEEALGRIAAALGLERARREAGRDPDLGVVVAREPPQHWQHLERAELGEVADRGDLDLGLEIVIEHDERGVAAGRGADLGQRGERGGGLDRIAEDHRREPIDGAHRAHPAERGDRGAPEQRGDALPEEP